MERSLIDHLSAFVAFRSIAGQEDEKYACLKWIEESFLQEKAKDIMSGNVRGAPYLLLNHPDPQLLWFAHIDVVPGDDTQYQLSKSDDKIFARGAKDMKGAALPFLLAFRDSIMNKKNPRVSILLTSDEENSGHSIAHLLEKRMFGNIPVAFTPDTGSSPSIVTAHKGAVWATLVCEGQGTHGASPWEGKNPLFLLSDALMSIRRAFPHRDSSAWELTVSPTQLFGSDAKNKVPDEARCTLDIRFPPDIFPMHDDALDAVAKILPAGCHLEEVDHAASLKTDPAHPMVQRIKRIAEDVTKHPIEIGREHGASDARSFGEAGIPSFLYGPVGGGLHGSNEWVSLSSLVDHYEISKRLLEELE